MRNKELIINLIKDDLTNIRLVAGLNRLGLDSGNYYLHLSQTLFTLMGFKENNQVDRLHKEYYQHAQKAVKVDIAKHPQQLTDIAIQIFDMLKAEKKQGKGKKVINCRD